ncbi:hypothetical protein HH310_12640 [Actinoplanes sp. TBRC 11911]|nr:hypothetical protein [Actinoplanes sp. TBRC 11911]NMO52041.1 hypothetical protein [Actinoplanes sp. TBRC 11911]
MSSLDRANRRLNRASRIVGFLATLWLIGFWSIVIAAVGLGVYVLVG